MALLYLSLSSSQVSRGTYPLWHFPRSAD